MATQSLFFTSFPIQNPHHQEEESFGDYVVTELLLSHSGVTSTTTPAASPATRRVFHIQFLSWPDYGVPLSAGAMLDFLGAARDLQKRGLEALETAWRLGGGEGRAWKGHAEGPPVVIHCSAGIGRTGTFIATDISTRRLEDIGTVDIDKTVRRIRTQRASSIQVGGALVWLLACLSACLSLFSVLYVTRLLVCWSVCLFLQVSLSACVSLRLSFSLSCLAIYLTVCPSVRPRSAEYHAAV